jgi:hypothetical protein
VTTSAQSKGQPQDIEAYADIADARRRARGRGLPCRHHALSFSRLPAERALRRIAAFASWTSAITAVAVGHRPAPFP